MPERLPLRRYPREVLVLALIALCTLGVLYPEDAEDATYTSATESIIHGTLRVDPYASLMLDKAGRNGHWYSDKAPGLSFLAVPTVALLEASHRTSSPSDAL